MSALASAYRPVLILLLDMSIPTTTSTIPTLAQVGESVIPAPVAMTSPL